MGMPFRAVEEAGKLLVRAEALVAEAKRKEAARRAAERELNDSLPGFFTKADPERLRAVRAKHPALNDLPHPWLTILRVLLRQAIDVDAPCLELHLAQRESAHLESEDG